MSQYSDWMRWSAQCRDRPGFGITAGDTMHCGLGDYVSLRPCPNGLPIDTREPGETEWGRERVVMARRDIAAHRRQVSAEVEFEHAAIVDTFTEDAFERTVREFAESQIRFERLMKEAE